jgi:formate-nitrite transporter family protein
MTLMTWMDQGTDSVAARLVVAVATAFLLGAGPLNHVIVSSLEAFAALQVGASFGYPDWLGAMAFAGLGNLVGGIGLVTLLRLVQAGGRAVSMVRE